MDFAAWKNVLLEWATCTSFLDEIYYSLTQTNIQMFYRNFRAHLTSVEICEENIVDFLNNYYPTMEINTTKDGEIMDDDYIYVYSLLLHFSCVRFPETDIQVACQQLKPNSQHLIASFFKLFIDKNCFYKETLQAAISEAVSPPEPYGAISTSPVKSEAKCTPPTPRTKILDEYNSENKHLKALVETERFEKGFIEIQLKQTEEKFKNLSIEHRKCIDEIHDLRNKLLFMETENISPNKNANDEQIKRRFRKELAIKDDLILQLKSEINNLNDEKDHLGEVQINNERQIAVLNGKINELNFILEESHRETQEKDVAIKELQALKNDLQYFIESGRNNFDVSVECIDSSFIRESSQRSDHNSSKGSPENLCRSVVDIQLREQLAQNRELMEELDFLKEKHLNDIEEITIKLQDTQKLLQSTVDYADTEIQKLASENDHTKMKLNALNAEKLSICREIEIWEIKSKKFEEELHKSNAEVKDLNEKIICLTDEGDNLKVTLEKQIEFERVAREEISQLLEKFATVQQQVDKLTLEVSLEKNKCLDLNNEIGILKCVELKMKEKVENYETMVKSKANEYSMLTGQLIFLQNENDQYKESSLVFSQKINDLEKENEALLTEIDMVKLSITELNNNIEKHHKEYKSLEEEKTKLSDRLDTVKQESQQYKIDADRFKFKLISLQAETEKTVLQLETQNSNFEEHDKKYKSLKEENTKLSDNLDALKQENQQYLVHVDNLESKLASLRAEKEETVLQLKTQNTNFEKHLDEYKSLEEEKTKISDHLDAVEQENHQYLVHVDNLELKLASLQAEKEELVLQLKIQNNNLEKHLNEYKFLEEEKTKISDHLDAVEQENQQYIVNVDNLESKLSSLQAEKEETILRLGTEFEQKINEKENAFQKQCEEYNEMCFTKNELERLVTDLRSNLLETENKYNIQVKQFNEEKQTLKETIIQNEETLNEMRLNRDELQKNIIEMESQLTDSSNRIEQMSSKLNKAQKLLQYTVSNADLELQKVTKELDRVQKKVGLSEREKNKLKCQTEILQNEKKTLEEQKENLGEQIKNLNVKRAELHNECENLKVGVAEKLKLEKMSEETISNLNSEIKTTVEELKMIKGEHGKLIVEFEIEQKSVQSLEDKLQHTTDGYEKLLTETGSYKDQIASLILEKMELDAQIVTLNNDLADVSNKLANAKQDNYQLREDVSNLVIDIRNVQSDYKLLKNDNAQYRLNSEEILNELKSKYINHIQEVSHKLLTTQKLLKSTVSYADLEILKITKELENIQKEVQCLEQDKLKKENEIKSLKSEISNLKICQTNSNAIVTELNGKISSLIDKCKKLELNLVNKSEIEKENIEKISNLTSEISILQQNITHAECQKEEIASQLKLSENQFHEKCCQYEELQIKHDNFNKQVESLVEDKKNLEMRAHNLSLVKLDNMQLTENATNSKIQLLEEENNLIKNGLDKITQDLILLNIEKKEVYDAYAELQSEANYLKETNEQLKESTCKLTLQLEMIEKEKSDIVKEVDASRQECRNQKEIAEDLKIKWEKLQIEIIANQQRNAQLENELKCLLDERQSRDESEYAALLVREKELSQAVAILQAKLIKNRENTALKEKEWEIERENLQTAKKNEQESADERIKQNRNELEGKLEKMKMKMKTLYSEEVAKVKSKYEQELFEFKNKVHQQDVKIQEYELHVEKLARQMFQLNESNLELKKQNEMIKIKVRFMEENPYGSKRALTTAMGIGTNLKMEDEESELFNIDYLEQLKAGECNPSVSYSELKCRNSMLPMHLRSSYAAQYGDNCYSEDDIKIHGGLGNESIVSDQSEIRRGTLYQKPGPPTPSKNGGRLSLGGSGSASGRLSLGGNHGGRLSFGASDLPRDPLKESNGNNAINSSRAIATKKHQAPSTFRSMFASSKVRDENSTPKRRLSSIFKLHK